ncbi:acyl carrier protein [Streptomonospora litoralis]|uniref:Polyketide synthase PksJ n=1 Tax=Streptomonospora litoralis TaxID=2498135 RepID=A0A4P6Q1D2_9ACTN|nr:acyl carrier protein [Streptomonospora litoralis]QBI52619.1 Polyketide synthase PksJ [Streptomonospora litoralis]
MPSHASTPSTDDLSAWLSGCVAKYARLRPDQIEADRPLTDYGLDSVNVFVLCGDIEDRFGIEIEPTSAWDYPTVQAFADHLAHTMAQRSAAPSETAGGAR